MSDLSFGWQFAPHLAQSCGLALGWHSLLFVSSQPTGGQNRPSSGQMRFFVVLGMLGNWGILQPFLAFNTHLFNFWRYMKSKFGFASYLPVLLGLALTFLVGGFIFLVAKGLSPAPGLRGLPVVLILSFTLVWLFWGEFRTKMIIVIIDGDSLSVRKFGGLGKTSTYLLSNFDGFTTSRQSYGARGILEYLYLKNGGKKVVKISEAYHKNYKDLKAAVQGKAKDLGYERFSFFDEFKEIFG